MFVLLSALLLNHCFDFSSSLHFRCPTGPRLDCQREDECPMFANVRSIMPFLRPQQQLDVLYFVARDDITSFNRSHHITKKHNICFPTYVAHWSIIFCVECSTVVVP